MSLPTNLSQGLNPSLNPSSSNNNNIQINTNNHQNQNGNNLHNNNIDENEEMEDDNEMDEIDEIAEEEQEEKEEDKNLNNKDEFANKNKGEEGQSKLERAFIYLRSGFSWRPIPTINSTVLCLEITGAIFIAIGIIIIIFSNKIVEIEIRYDNKPECKIGLDCTLTLKVEKEMEKNVFVYYRLKNFYQNHRRYIKSKSYKQLKGDIMTEGSVKDDCDPIILNKDIYEGVTSMVGNTPLDPNGVAHPCGLIAKSFFNDTFELKRGSEDIQISAENIAWSVDKDKYKDSSNKSMQWRSVEDERFMVWMRPAAMPDFRKLWGRIEMNLKRGSYSLIIHNNYPVESFDGKKFFILSTVNGLGGKNYFLGILYLAIGGVSAVSGILFWFGYKRYNIEKNEKID